MSTRDMYDKKMLKAMESIAKSLNRIANVMERKSDSLEREYSHIEESEDPGVHVYRYIEDPSIHALIIQYLGGNEESIKEFIGDSLMYYENSGCFKIHLSSNQDVILTEGMYIAKFDDSTFRTYYQREFEMYWRRVD